MAILVTCRACPNVFQRDYTTGYRRLLCPACLKKGHSQRPAVRAKAQEYQGESLEVVEAMLQKIEAAQRAKRWRSA